MSDKHTTAKDSAKIDKQKKRQNTPNKENNLKGTFILVMLLGGFIIVSWAAVYLIFITR